MKFVEYVQMGSGLERCEDFEKCWREIVWMCVDVTEQVHWKLIMCLR